MYFLKETVSSAEKEEEIRRQEQTKKEVGCMKLHVGWTMRGTSLFSVTCLNELKRNQQTTPPHHNHLSQCILWPPTFLNPAKELHMKIVRGSYVL